MEIFKKNINRMRQDTLSSFRKVYFHWKGLLILLLVLGACKKTELPPTVEEDPVFSFTGNLDNQSLDFVAGEEDYYLFTSFRKDDNNVYSFMGRFEKTMDCESDCKEILEFEIRDIGVDSGADVMPDRSLGVGSYPIGITGSNFEIDTIVEGYDVFFENRSISNVSTNFNWDLGDGISIDSFLPGPLFLSPADIGQGKDVRLTLTENSGTGSCSSTLLQRIQIGGDPNSSCSLDFVSLSDSVINTLCADMSGVDPFVFRWILSNDSIIMEDCLEDFDFVDSMSMVLTGIDGQGCEQSKNISTHKSALSELEYCSADFDYEVLTRNKIVFTPIEDSLSFSNVIVRYTDREGITFTSGGIDQNQEDRFEILESSDYLVNENGEATRLLKIRFSGFLSNDGNNPRYLENGEGVIAVSYPK